MPELSFRVDGIEPLRHAASPHLIFRLALEQEKGKPVAIQNILLHVQLRIEPHLRSDDEASRLRLAELFGAAEQWSRTVHGMRWTTVDAIVPRFIGRTSVDLAVPCTYDFNVAATRYFDGTREGEVPLRLLFSGTIFYAGESGSLQVALIPWEKEAECRLPLQAWKDMMELYYPRSAWLRIGKDVFDRLLEYKRRTGATGWEKAFEQLLESAEARDPR
jgi:hypothetical protein